MNATFARIAQEIKALPIDVLICFGDKTKQLYSGVKQYGKIETIFCSNMEDLIKCLQKVGDNDLILFKAVVSQCLPFAVDRVFGTDICINGGYYRQEHARRYRHKGYVYMIFECFNSRAASLDYYGGENDNIIIENEIDNTKITYICWF